MIKGYSNLMKKFNQLDNIIQDGITHHVDTQVKKIQAQAKQLCPVDTDELRNSINSSTQRTEYGAMGTVYTNKMYGPYVELGTGPTGQENHLGISPNINVVYSQKGWSYKDDSGEWIHTRGQAAQPFMYPALKNNEQKVVDGLKDDIKLDIRKGLK